MELISYIGFGLLIIMLPLAILIGMLILIWKKDPYGKYVSLALGIGVIFVIVTAIWPMDSFYLDELRNNSNLEVSGKYEVLSKNSSYPDMHGDYYSEAVLRVTDMDFSSLSGDLKPIEKCTVPSIAEPFLPADYGSVKCWASNRNIDEWFSLIYFPDRGILYFRFDQT